MPETGPAWTDRATAQGQGSGILTEAGSAAPDSAADAATAGAGTDCSAVRPGVFRRSA